MARAVRCCLFALISGSIACAGGGSGDDGYGDGYGNGDASASFDATTSADADANADAVADADADADADAAAVADADAAPPAAPPATGLSWPPGQVFPSFSPPGPLDVILTTNRANDALTLSVTLEGLVNKTRPRIFVSDDGTASKLWLSELGVATTTVSDPLSLVLKYKSEIAGIVVTDDAQADTLNLATTIAGVKGGIVASPALATTLTASPYFLPVLDDLRAQHFASKLDVYQYELDNYAAQCTHRLIVGLTPSIVDHLRDYAVATQAIMVWLDPTNATESAMLGRFLGLLAPNSPYMGWWTSEPDGVHLASTYGVPVYAADWSMNLTVLGGAARGTNPPKAPPPPPLENKVYVAIFMSDGDNLQEDEGLVPLKWADSARGSVPVSWTINPGLVDVAPLILRYFERTGTVNDELVAGPSGLGYTYPAAWPAATFDDYAKLSAHYMSAAGLRVATVWNNGADLSAANAQSYATHMSDVLGLTIQDATSAQQWQGALPIERMTVSYADTEAALESGIDGAIGGFDRTKPVFAAVQGDMNSGTIHPTAFADVQSHYAANTNVVFVRGDQFFQLLGRAHAPPSHRVWFGDFDGDRKTDALFVYGGNGDVWLGKSDGTQLAWSKAGTSASFGDLLDGSHSFQLGDFDGDGALDLLFYYEGDGNVWLGTFHGGALAWTKLGAIASLMDGKHDVRVGDYDGDHKDDLAVYASDGSWQLGISSGSAIAWKSAGSTSGFGDLVDGSHAFYDGDFDGDGKRDVLFYYDGDTNLWLGKSSGSALAWSNVGNTSGFGDLIDGGHRLVAGDFDGDGKTDLLFHYEGDGNWWLGISSGSGFTWSNAGNTKALGDFRDWNHHVAIADVDGDGKRDVVVADSASGTWFIGRSDGKTLTFAAAGTATGDAYDYGHLVGLGDFDGDGKSEPTFYEGSSGAWSMGKSSGAAFAWHAAGNTSGFGDLTK